MSPAESNPAAHTRAIIAIVGPTASGKSDLALDIADRLGGPDCVEIIGADAFQLYRGMDIGTAKLPPDQRRGYTHHQIDVLESDQDASVAHYQQSARFDIAAIKQRGAQPIVVGGSGLYVRALLDEMNFPGHDPDIRQYWLDRAEQEGAETVYRILQHKDPLAAARIDPLNVRRVVRALEVIDITGAPFSANLPHQEYVQPTIQIGIDYGREKLDERIAARVDAMWQAGLVDEVAALIAPGAPGLSQTALRAVGYRQVIDMLNGDITVEQAKDQIVIATRRLARKQMGWFGRDPRITWLRADLMDRRHLADQALEVIEHSQNQLARGALPQYTNVPSIHEPTRRRLGS